MDGGPNDVLRPKKVIQQYWEIDKRKSRPQALAEQKYALGETSSKVTSHPKDPQPRLIQLPLLPQDGSQVGHGVEACTGDSCRGALRTLQELGGAGPPPGVLGLWHRWCGAPGLDPPVSTM